MRLCTAFRFLCTLLTVWIAGALPASSATKNIILLFDERLDLPGLAALDADLVSTLASNSSDRIEVYREAMDLSRLGSDNYKILLRDFLREKYASKKIDVAVTILSPALDFWLSHGDAIFAGVPVVFCGIDRKELADRALPHNFRGVLVKREFAPSLEIALRLHPQAKRVVVVAGTSEFDTRLLDQARVEFRAYEDRLAFTYLTSLPMQKLLTELSQLPPQTIVLFTTLFQDGAGEPFVTHDAVQRIAEAASVPVYGFVDQYLGRGIVGGSLYSFSAQGGEAAKLVLQVLAGPKDAGPALVEPHPNKVLFDWRQLQRWGIPESSLPSGSEIRFRNSTLWDQYRVHILTILAVVLLQSALITWLIYEHRRRHLAEVQTRNSMSELAYVNRKATAGELSATIAHEVSQPLTGMVANAHAALRWLSREQPDVGNVREALNQIVAAGHRASDVVTSVRAMFRKDTQEKAPLHINKLIWSVLGLVSIDLRTHSIVAQTSLAEHLPPVLGNEVQLQQVVLNLVMNAIEAMNSTEHRVLSIKSELTEDHNVHVSVEDTGSGIDPSNMDHIFNALFTTKARGMGMGLSICRSIIESHNGRIWVTAAAPRGTIFHFVIPTGN